MSIEVTGIEEIQHKLSTLSSTVKNMSPIMKEIGNMVKNDITDSFRNSRSPFGEAWAPNKIVSIHLSHQSLGRKNFTKDGVQTKAFQKFANGKKPLILSSGLMRSFTYDATNDSVTVGTNWGAGSIKGGAAIHQFGGMAGRGRKVKIPARPFMPIDKSGNLEPSLRTAILSYVDGKLEEAVR